MKMRKEQSVGLFSAPYSSDVGDLFWGGERVKDTILLQETTFSNWIEETLFQAVYLKP